MVSSSNLTFNRRICRPTTLTMRKRSAFYLVFTRTHKDKPRMSSAPTMSIQHCPDEILDMIFQLLPIQSPDKAPAVLLPAILTCSRFCAIAKRHLIRVVCLQTAQRVDLFAAYLVHLTDTGAYGKALLPIEHMAVFGKHQIPRGLHYHDPSAVEMAVECVLPFIIEVAAPSLRSLTVFGFAPQYREVDGQLVETIVKPSICFPKLQRLILLEQLIISFDRREGPQEGSLSHCFPQLMSLYTHKRHLTDDVLALRTLCELRFDTLGATVSDLPSSQIPHIETIIIDVPRYESTRRSGHKRWHQTRTAYNEKIEIYRTFIKAISSSPKSSAVITRGNRICPEFVLGAWKDTVQGGSGCWKEE